MTKENVKLDEMMELEMNCFDVSVALGIDPSVAPVSKATNEFLMDILKKEGFNLDKEEDRVKALAHVTKNAEKYSKLVDQCRKIEAVKNHGEFAGIIEAVKKLQMVTDSRIMFTVNLLVEDESPEFITLLNNAFGEDNNAAKAEFIRKEAGIKIDFKTGLKIGAVYAADTVRFGGLTAEAVLDKTGEFIAWTFSMAGDGVRIGTEYVGKGIDKLAGGRPEEVKDTNVVEDAVKPHTSKVSGWFDKMMKKAGSKLQGEKKEEVADELTK